MGSLAYTLINNVAGNDMVYHIRITSMNNVTETGKAFMTIPNDESSLDMTGNGLNSVPLKASKPPSKPSLQDIFNLIPDQITQLNLSNNGLDSLPPEPNPYTTSTTALALAITQPTDVLQFILDTIPAGVNSINFNGKTYTSRKELQSVITVLSNIKFDEYLHQIRLKTYEMNAKSESDTSYLYAALVSEKLYKVVNQAIHEFLFNEGTVEQKTKHFKRVCLNAIIEARPALQHFNDYKDTLTKTAVAISSLVTFEGAYIIAKGYGFFSPKTLFNITGDNLDRSSYHPSKTPKT